MRDLRKNPWADRHQSANLCDLVWQGDFGKGIATGSGVYSDPGINPYVIYGPISATATSVMAFSTGFGSNAIPQIQFRLGLVAQGDYETEWIFCRYVSTGTPDLLPGQVWQIDENYSASLITTTTAAANLNAQVGVSYVFFPAIPAGTYYFWLARAGRVIVQAAASSLAGGGAQTGATAGQVKFLTTHTAGTWQVSPFSAFAASSNITFLGDTVNGQPYITNIKSQISINGVTGGLTDIVPGAVITGTNMPSNALIKTIDQLGAGGTYRITLGTNTAGAMNTTQNASGTAAGTTFTITNMVQGLLYWPTTANAVT